MGNANIHKLEKELGINFPTGAHFIGFENKQGYLCYMNSVLQALFYSSSFRERLIHSKGLKQKDTLLASLADLFESISTFKKNVGVISTKKFITKVKKENALYDNEDHQDAHEFMIWLLNEMSDGLVKEMKVKAQEQNLPDQKLKSWISDIFEGTASTVTRCLCCETVSTRDEPFFDLSLEVEQNTSLTHSIKSFCSNEMLKGNDKFFCESCCCLQEAEKGTKIKKLPEILIIHLKRFKYIENLGHRKLNYQVHFPFEIRLPQLETPDEDFLFELTAIIVHLGHGLQYGHYFSIIKFGEIWIKLDDETLADDSLFRQIFGSSGSNDFQGWPCAYMLFYQKLAPSSGIV